MRTRAIVRCCCHRLSRPVLALAVSAVAMLTCRQGITADKPAETPRPNFVVFLIDDLGWTDLGCFGSKLYETPNVDRLAAEGMRFTSGYSACTVCSPTRAAIVAGKYPARLHLTDWIAGHVRKNAKLQIPDWRKYLPLEEVTLAEALKPAGYTCGHVGKWHLGDEPYYPQHQGFDVNIAGDKWGAPASYFWPYGKDARRVPLAGGKEGEYLTDRLTDEAIGFLRQNHDKPFFLYFAHYAVHMPLQAKKEVIAKYEAKLASAGDGGQRCPVYAAMIHSMDESVGRIRQTLCQLKLDQRTVVFFTSDNGGLVLPAWRGLPATSNAPLRAGKGSAYEGGVRVPWIASWPGVTKPKSVSDAPVISMDLYPTILQIAGVAGDPKHRLDGESLVPLLKRTGRLRRHSLYWHYPHYHPGGATPYGAVREGDFKLIEFFEDNHAELYDLRQDLSETKDLSKTMPAKAKSLRRRLQEWRKSVAAQMPTANPGHEEAKAK